MPTADLPINFADGTLIKIIDTNYIYIIEGGKKRKIADNDTFLALGYKKEKHHQCKNGHPQIIFLTARRYISMLSLLLPKINF